MLNLFLKVVLKSFYILDIWLHVYVKIVNIKVPSVFRQEEETDSNTSKA